MYASIRSSSVLILQYDKNTPLLIFNHQSCRQQPAKILLAMKKSVLSVVFLSVALALNAFSTGHLKPVRIGVSDNSPSTGELVPPMPEGWGEADTSMVMPAAGWPESKELEIRTFQDIIIDANVVVVLVEDGGNLLRMEGNAGFLKYVQVKEQEGTLKIISPRKGSKVKGYLWVPVKGLKTLRLGNNAIVRSAAVLNSPQLDIELNGSCDIGVVTNGMINLIENEDIEFFYHKNSIRNVTRASMR